MYSLKMPGNMVGLVKPIPKKWQNFFLYGYCSTLAVAMKEKYGLPIYKIHNAYGIVHCFNRIVPKIFIDIRGMFHKDQMYDYPFTDAYRLEYCNYEVFPLCKHSLKIAYGVISKYFGIKGS